MGSVAGAIEADRASIGQRGDEMRSGVVPVKLALAAVDDQHGQSEAAEQRARILCDERFPDRGHRLGVVAGKLGARPVGGFAHALRDGLSEYRLAGVQCETLEIVADRGRARGASLRRQAERPIAVVEHPGRHVDDHRAGEPFAGGSGQHLPEHGGAERPADSDRAFEVERLHQLGDIRGEPLDARRRARAPRFAMPAQVDNDEPMVGGERLLRAEEAAMGQQAVEQHERCPGALVAIGDSRPIRCREMPHSPSPPRAPVRGLRPEPSALN